MTIRIVGGRPVYVNYKKLETKELIVLGYYRGRTKNMDDYGHYGFLIKSAEGPTKQLNYAGHLEWLIEGSEQRPEVGDAVLIYYSGQIKVPTGPMKGKMAHSFIMASGDTTDELRGYSYGDVENDNLGEVEESPITDKAFQDTAVDSGTVNMSDLD